MPALFTVCYVLPQVLGGQLVTDLKPGPDGRSIGTVVARDVTTGQTTSHTADAVVFAIGITGMQKLVQQCRILGDRQELRDVMNLRAIDVIATRLWWVPLADALLPQGLHACTPGIWPLVCRPMQPSSIFICDGLQHECGMALGSWQRHKPVFSGVVWGVLWLACRFDRLVKTRYPANVLSGFEAAAGATFFNLNELQVRAAGGAYARPGNTVQEHASRCRTKLWHQRFLRHIYSVFQALFIDGCCIRCTAVVRKSCC